MRLTNNMRDAFVRAAMQDVPTTDYREELRIYIQKVAFEKLPLIIQTAYSNINTQPYIETVRYHNDITTIYHPGYTDVRLTAEEQAHVDKLEKKHNAELEKMAALRTKIYAVARSATTRKQLLEMLPEFEKYLPENPAAADRSVPCIQNVVSDFMKAGWPANKEKAA